MSPAQAKAIERLAHLHGIEGRAHISFRLPEKSVVIMRQPEAARQVIVDTVDGALFVLTQWNEHRRRVAESWKELGS